MDASNKTNLEPYTVGELSGALKRTIETEFGQVRVRGEISRAKRLPSGHIYFSLKDETAVIEAVIWRSSVPRLATQPEDGTEVIATGKLTTYGARSQYQLIVEALELAGEGALLKQIEERKKRLAAEGLFDPARKKPLPSLPTVIGVVTSASGAVIRDILHRLEDRFPRRVLVWPVAVQGAGSAEQIAAAIRGFNALPIDGEVPRPDVLIVARGGGSLEDLMAFNEEIVVRAAADSAIPLISAVGHETDTTLIDFASDRRAPTPTAAAEFAVPVRADLLARVREIGGRLDATAMRGLEQQRTHLTALSRGLVHPRQLVEGAWQRVDDLLDRLSRCAQVAVPNRLRDVEQLGRRLRSPAELLKERSGTLDLWTHRLQAGATRLAERKEADVERWGALLESLSYRRVLDRGYALVRDGQGVPVTQANDARGALTIEFKDGVVQAAAGIAPKRKRDGEPKDQAGLF
ncbi:exodeoxyribonuclease VII large subunit [Roseiterribacter gracilis]|uniref:Exodeoxyribonuclease 7 large subunit n=1 Tax=Roseiterribacter gracilis TaxID=2812848 RepID=A0A8S8XHJ7_9PROT|nr:exodeoxyribonuclease 7 large subunit [Rhodospirillales bacterium TMPK1]